MNHLTDPQGIERKSMSIIAPYLAPLQLTAAQERVYERIIHATGDPEYAGLIVASPAAVAAGVEALGKGAGFCTDVQMVKAGINARNMALCGATAQCLIAAEEVALAAERQCITRAMAAMRIFGPRLHGQIVVIGNAPTALFEVLALMEANEIRPALIIGVPVGFVGAAESKEALIKKSTVPYITVRGSKGGSAVAAAVCNALLNMAVSGESRGE